MSSFGTLPSGIRVRVEARGPKCAVDHLGVALVGLAIVEKETDEPLQYLTNTSDAEALVRQWDEVVARKLVHQ
jgi:hypothetical protein